MSANTEVRLEGTRDRAGSGGLSEGVQLPERVLSPLGGPRSGLNCRGWYRRMQSWVGQDCGQPRDPPTPAQTTYLPGIDHLPIEQGPPTRADQVESNSWPGL